MASLYFDGDYGYYRGAEILHQSNGSAQRVPVSAYRSLTNERSTPHSHAKHSSYKGRPFMVGALARLSARQEKLTARAAEAMGKLGLKLPSGNPLDNNLAQAVELVLDVELALLTVEKLLAYGCREEARVPVHPKEGAGSAATEAPRGLLFHSYSYDVAGRAVTADVITPTALNAASIEDHLRATAEQASGTPVPALRRHLEMVARAYDPCVSCSVHVLQISHAG
jgi:coenzyme F420-reducing hydrogenase alpha subunit